jgi:hypothetical protein
MYIIHNDLIYHAHDTNIEPYEDIFTAYKDSDGNINYELKYYNGGCCFSEAMEIALKNLK